MSFNLQTPTLLFSAISLLMLAYTNRFVVIAGLIRDLHRQYLKSPDEILKAQLINLRKRMRIIRNMQIFGGFSFLFSVLSLLLIFANAEFYAKAMFMMSLIALLISLALLIAELQISVNALNIQLKDFKED